MTADFLSEQLGIIVHVDHPNIARLIGYGIEGGMHVVLQLSPHGSLASILYGPREKLDWNTRYKIALGAAEGLRYLHEECQRRIIHRNVKEGLFTEILRLLIYCTHRIFSHRYLILGLQNGYLTNGLTILSPNLKAHSGITDVKRRRRELEAHKRTPQV